MKRLINSMIENTICMKQLSLLGVIFSMLFDCILILHFRHFIKIPFINKGIEFIDLSSIFKDNSVTSSIPTYFENTESPMICYQYNKPIRNTILYFNKLVSDLDFETSSPDS